VGGKKKFAVGALLWMGKGNCPTTLTSIGVHNKKQVAKKIWQPALWDINF
jgi:hypothetical protein